MTENKEVKFEELEKLVFSKKANAFEKMKYAELLKLNTLTELREEKEQRIEKIFDLMEELEITKDELLDKLRTPPALIFEWNGNKRYEGERGKLPGWTQELKKLNKNEALKFVINNNQKGIKFIDNLYKDN